MDKKIPDGVVLTAAWALSKEWNLHYPDAVRMAALVLSVGQQHPEWQPAETSNARREWPARYMANGPQGTFYTDDLKLADALLRAYDEDDDWTVTEMPDPAGTLAAEPDAGESSFILPGLDPLVQKLLSIVIKYKEQERTTARAEQSASEAERAFFAQDFYEEARAGKKPWPAQQPAPSAPVGVDAAKHWHDLYRKECQLRQDDAARYGQQIADLEALAQQATAAHEPCAAVAAIQFALTDPEGMTFLRLWNEGEFDTLRREWPDALRKVYGGADPLA